MIDNFVVSGEVKWNIQSGLVLSLPHGLDGQGPEHSSARLERFLQASNDNTDVETESKTLDQRIRETNIQVAYCSNSANYFHILRRQLKRDYRKPLILMVSKKLLKLKAASGRVSDIEEGTEFQALIEEPINVAASGVKKLIFCSGQFFYELKNWKDEKKIDVIY
jgi:2-oxoglutarate dehydrogenase E1 component